MNPKVQEFIENNLDIIDQDDWMQIFMRAYDDLSNTQIKVFINMMKDAGLDYVKIIAYRDAALRFIITHQMEDLPSDSKWSPIKFTGLLSNYLGLSYAEIIFFIYNEQDEWPGEIQILGDSADDYMIWVF